MTDLDRILRESLRSLGETHQVADHAAARERFLVRRRRRTFLLAGSTALATATAVIVAIVVFSVRPLSERAPREVDVAAGRLEVVATVPAGESPVGIASGHGSVWVADTQGRAVVRLNAETGEEQARIPLEFAPDDVAVTASGAWVVAAPADGTEDTVAMIDPLTDRVARYESLSADVSGHIDIASGVEHTVFVSQRGSEEVVVFDDDGGRGSLAPMGSVVDVASDRADPLSLWTYSDEGEVAEWTADGRPVGDPNMVGMSDHSDLVAAFGSAYIALGDYGEVIRVDGATHDTPAEHRNASIEGPYIGLAAGDGYVWALAYGEGGKGTLYRLDPDTAQTVGEPLSLGGRPVDLVVSGGYVWVSNERGGTVTVVAEEGDDDVIPEPTTSPTPDQGTGVDDLVFVYSAAGDIYGETVGGDRLELVTGKERETWPSLSPDGTAMVFQRGFDEITHLALATGQETVLTRGQYPSWGPDGRIAWVVDNAAGETKVLVGVPFSEPEAEIRPDPHGYPTMVHPPIAWSPRGDYLYFQAGWEQDQSLVEADAHGDDTPFSLTEAVGGERGMQFRAPSVRMVDGERVIYVLRFCCSIGPDDAHEGAEFGAIFATEGGPTYERVGELDPRMLPIASMGNWPFTAAAGGLELRAEAGERTWSAGDAGTSRSWFIGNAEDVWLASDAQGLEDYVSDLLITAYGYPTIDEGGTPGTFEGWDVAPAFE